MVVTFNTGAGTKIAAAAQPWQWPSQSSTFPSSPIYRSPLALLLEGQIEVLVSNGQMVISPRGTSERTARAILSGPKSFINGCQSSG